MLRDFRVGLAVLAVAVAAALVTAHAAEVPEAEWQRLADGPDRALHAMIYDSANDLYWSFGGVEADPGSDKIQNSVYRLSPGDPGARWQLVPIGGLRPPPTEFHSAVYDPVRERMLVYGGLVDRRGLDDQEPADPRSLWALELADPEAPTWTRIPFTGGVGDRFGHAAAYVPDADAMVVTGGLQTFDVARDDGFALILSDDPPRHVRLANAGFGRRGGHALLYHEPTGRLLAYGGTSSLAGFDAYNDVVMLDLSAGLEAPDRWTRVSTKGAGSRRAFAATAFDPVRQLWWVHGGFQGNNEFLRDLSALSLGGAETEWLRTTLVYNGPLDRFGHVAIWDPARGRAVFQGGTPDNAVTLPDTRALVFEAAPTASATATETETATGTAQATPSASETPEATVSATSRPTGTATSTSTRTATARPEETPTAPGGGAVLYLPSCTKGA